MKLLVCCYEINLRRQEAKENLVLNHRELKMTATEKPIVTTEMSSPKADSSLARVY